MSVISVISSDSFLGPSVDKIPFRSTQARKRSNERSNLIDQRPKVSMLSPKSHIKATLNNLSLPAGGSDFPCKKHLTLSNYKTGQSYTMKFQVGITYGRWSC